MAFSPIIFRQCNKLPTWIILAGTFLIYCSAWYVRFYSGYTGWIWEKYGTFGMTLFEFILGAVCLKEKWFTKAKKILTSIPKVLCAILGVSMFIGILLGHTLVIANVFVAPFTGLIIIFLFIFWNKADWIKKFFLFIGKHSTNIWLTHMFFYNYIFVNLVFIAKYPIFILGFMLIITIFVSIMINFLMNKIGTSS